MRAVGVAGTAKNTGKTTSLVALLAESARRGTRMAVTSIGYDGEAFDHLTGLPKPRIMTGIGMLVATAEATLSGASAGLDLVARTGALTTLGEVVVARVSRPGLVPVAGPPTGAGLRLVLEALEAQGAELCLVDGAFGRMAPMARLDGLILATGAARTRNLDTLLAETAAIAWIFGLPLLAPVSTGEEAPTGALGLGPTPTAAGIRHVPNLLTPEQALRALLGPAGTPLSLCVTGAVTTESLEILAGSHRWSPASTLLFADAVRLVLAGDPTRSRRALESLAGRIRVGVAHRLPLLALTVNPFYPDLAAGSYRSAILDTQRLRSELSRALPVPVVDVVEEGAMKLSSLLI